MSRIFLISICLLLSSCSTVKPEFARVDPEEVGIVIGYEVTGSKTLNPRLTGAGYIAGFFIPGLTGLAVSLGSITLNEFLRTDDAVTMVDELNDAIYERLEQQLIERGYQVRLLKKQQTEFTAWADQNTPASYVERIGSRYQLTESDLQASGVDTVLYVEYRVDANIASVDELTSMAAVDLKIDHYSRNVLAYSMPPANKVLFSKRVALAGYTFRRMTFEELIEFLPSLEQWPDRNG